MRRRLTLLVMVAALMGVSGLAAVGDGHLPSSTFTAGLSGANEVPAVTSDGSGFASIEVAADGTSIDYRLYVNDLPDVTQAHIHVGPPDDNGPVAVFLFGFADPSVAADGLLAEGTITEADLVATDGVFDGTMDEFVALIEAGETYVNVHTEANPPGEIRGQLAPAAFDFGAELSGQNEVPPVDTAASGFTALSIDPSQTSIDYTVLTFGLVDTTQAHIHIGPPDANGPVAVFLFGFADPAVTTDGVLASGTITEGDLIATDGVFGGSMTELIDQMRAGNAYVNVHTLANPPGEIRGTTSGLERVTPGSRFVDDDGSVHEADIETIAAAGITVGCNPPANDEFCPEEGLTRGQGAAFFTRALNLAAPGDTDVFEDDDDSIFEADIDAVAGVGITVGCNPPANDEFCPDDEITRGQWASFMVRALGLSAGAGDDLFVDDDSSVHEADIDRIATAGITVGCNPPTNDEFCPQETVTRAQAASFFVRAMGWRAIAP